MTSHAIETTHGASASVQRDHPILGEDARDILRAECAPQDSAHHTSCRLCHSCVHAQSPATKMLGMITLTASGYLVNLPLRRWR